MDRTGLLQHQGIHVHMSVCPWPVGDDDADTQDLDEFDASALDHSKRTFDALFSTSQMCPRSFKTAVQRADSPLDLCNVRADPWSRVRFVGPD